MTLLKFLVAFDGCVLLAMVILLLIMWITR